ncbi:FG-GAP-like repeat-containing protein [Polyangium jinanense]|uniref:VCBS repeat-containing protein n=1 Tax=Polyangium jinanense TaxID=2829994 RepID=A0A9X4AUX4_9BACT|nr:FG-GAP-like repeat-containing protein [Polyangium jinanense]MDC3958096.1 VCBS repeat-containing protein [Polyangium jinanense]MDC3983705.1 VCBS repeat-containing protein [Polyangium jinanense]
MRTYRPSWRGGLLAALALASALSPHPASASWPPSPDADMADPANWPNDPGYAFTDDHDGQWNYYSFLPPAAPGVVRRADEVASGMSIDRAWRVSIGDPRVVIAVTDSGIFWEKPDLLDKAYLNRRELLTHKPFQTGGSPCGGDGDLAGFDCNGDGVFSVSDYATSMPLPASDRNANGVLDAGDLILAFSDGIDDDGNGYIDDISGWDFMKNDNDPYDDTRYGHGTGEAEDSSSQAHNGIGLAGACPRCMFLPLRVGDSFIGDVQAFGEAVVYATDSGAKVVQCALGTLNMTRFAQAALDYAYENKVLVITSMADENSRHHNMPAANNHTLPVHAIQYDGASARTSRSFVDFHPCSNYGGQNLLSASGTSCSSEATGQLSGIAGLLYSAALQYNTVPQLSPGEAQSIFFFTTDDIDVPESREPGSIYRFSQAGFDQRFGYGRVNASRALEAIRDGRIPPSVDIVSPRWFEVLYKDRASGPIQIRGTISAPRANAYDYVVEWASGVQPLEEDFQKHVLDHRENLDPTFIAGSAEPLALLDVRNVTVSHPRDVDSPFGENDHTITVRVRATAHYGGAVGDVQGEMRRTYYVHSDPDLARGFPVWLGDSLEASPKMADLDGDGVRELVVPTGGGAIHVLTLTKAGPVPFPGFPFQTTPIDGLTAPPASETPSHITAPGYASGKVDPNLAREGFMNAPAIADLDDDGRIEIVATTFAGTIYVLEADGSVRQGFPRRLPHIPSCPRGVDLPPPTGPCMDEDQRITRGAFASPVLVDLDRDGRLDIVQAAFDGKVHVFDADAAPLPGFPVEIRIDPENNPTKRSRILTTPAVADFNGDGVMDLVLGSNERLGTSGQFGGITVVDGRGTKAPEGPILAGWPVSLSSFELFPLVAEGIPNSPAIARFEGKLAAVAHGNVSLPFVVPTEPGGQTSLGAPPANALPARPDPSDPDKTIRGLEPSSIFGPLTRASQPNTMLPLFSSPSVGDLDQDGVPDVVASGGSLSLTQALQGGGTGAGEHLLAVWSGKTGAMLPGSPFLLEDFTFFNNHAIADLDGDDYPEVITGSGGYFLHAYDACGREPAGFPKFTGQWIASTAAVGDLDGDGTLEVAAGTRSGFLHVWHTRGRTDGVIAWESYHHDNRNTGNLETRLAQGTLLKAKAPLTALACEEARLPRPLEASGGCDCRAAGHGREGGRAAGLFFAGLALVLARRRPARS